MQKYEDAENTHYILLVDINSYPQNIPIILKITCNINYMRESVKIISREREKQCIFYVSVSFCIVLCIGDSS